MISSDPSGNRIYVVGDFGLSIPLTDLEGIRVSDFDFVIAQIRLLTQVTGRRMRYAGKHAA